MEPKKIRKREIGRHNERCPECKIRVKELLEKIYGQVRTNYRIHIATKPEEFADNPQYEVLSQIYTSLQNFRGFTEFVRASYVDVDFFIPSQGIIIEFDESQHFTEPRKITLSQYPQDYEIGFSLNAWMKRCDQIHTSDNDPPYRDEQRAWYDTIRDFIPSANEFLPTIRLYSRDVVWCALDPNKTEDVETFRNLLNYNPRDLKNWIATVTLQSNSYKFPDNDTAKNSNKNADRISALKDITKSLAKQYSGDGIILFPGGYFHSGTDSVEHFIPTLVEETRPLLQDIFSGDSSDIVLCIGIDGKIILDEGPRNRYDTNQVSMSISKDGLIAYAKKFQPTDHIEAEVVDLALDYLSTEKLGDTMYSRIFRHCGRSFYLAECNDIKGLKENPKPELVDCVLNCIHGCYNRNDGPTCTYYVRLNLAGLSREWKCPVFGSVVFFMREIADKWRTGLLYRMWDREPKYCSTDENALLPYMTDSSYLLEEGYAQVDVYDLDAVFGKRAEYRQNQTVQTKPVIDKHKITGQSGAISSIEASNLYQQLRQGLDHIFGESTIEQKTKYTYHGKNEIGYPNKDELDMISLFKPIAKKPSGVKIRIYPYILAGHIGLPDANKIFSEIPIRFTENQKQKNSNPGDIFIDGYISDSGEIEKLIQFLKFS